MHAQAKGLVFGIRALLREGDLAIDCGANVANRGGCGCVRTRSPGIRTAVRAMRRAKSVRLHNVAVGARQGQVDLMRSVSFDRNPLAQTVKSTVVSGSSEVDANSENMVSVPIVRLAAIIEERLEERNDIALLKLDIEGAELEVMNDLMDRDLLRHVRLTVVETHERQFPELRRDYRMLRRRVAAAQLEDRVFLDWI
nr:FkbM family methyltransferase [Ruegeria sediminis]